MLSCAAALDSCTTELVLRDRPVYITPPGSESEQPYNYIIISGAFTLGFIVGSGIVLGILQVVK